MNILVTGSTGLIGSELSSFLAAKGHHVIRMVRHSRPGADEIRWDPQTGLLDTQPLEGLDAVVHLAGENLSSGRWTAEKKRRIRDSRVKGTRLLVQSLSRLFDPPKVLVSVSAVGYYGNRGEGTLDEESEAGVGFLPDLCRDWEEATQPAVIRGIRVVLPRLGVVLSPTGGALSLMLPIFRLGLGGKIGSGSQYMSWIAIDDLVAVINHAIVHESLHGPVNAVAPNAATNLQFTQVLGSVLSRPAFLTLPSFAARIAFGEMADEMLLASANVTPARLEESGFKFQFPDLEGALRHVLKKTV